jgi:hypothetical protein
MRTGIAEKLSALCGLAAAALLSACGDTPSRPAPEDLATVQAGYGRAFGTIEYVEDGKKRTWANTAPGWDLALFVRSARTGEMQLMEIERDGDFLWPLKPDDYEIVAYQKALPANTGNRQLTGRLMITFSVLQAGTAVYIGKLRIRADRNRYSFGIADEYDEALKRAQERLVAGNFHPAKALMRPESQTGNYNQVIGICGGWGIVCSKEFQGVEPLSPEGTAQGFPVAASLTPLLSWKPSSRPEVAYDVAIYESLSIDFTGLNRTNRLRGPLVAYAEGLREPRFTPTTGLKPDRNYVWSVRLRDGDTVSSWSSTSYSLFLVIAATSGSGQAFGFSTPSK